MDTPLDTVGVALVFAKAILVLLVVLTLMPLMTWAERKVSAWIQDRVGPNRAAVGVIRLAGIVHVLADGFKMLSKELITPSHAEKFYYNLAPIWTAAVALMTFAVIPLADVVHLPSRSVSLQVIDWNVGVLWFLAVSSLSVYGIVFAGWSSNNKYALLGALRAGASVISYEIPLGLSLVSMLMVYGSFHLNEIAGAQGHLLFGFLPMWGAFIQPLAFIIFLICAFAETNRTPFDLVEGESELVAGFHTEYSAMKFGLFMLGEYSAVVVSSALMATLFFGGWQVPWLPTESLVRLAPTLAPAAFFAGSLALLALAALSVRFARRQGRAHANNRKEGMIYAAVCAALALALLAPGVLALGGLPAWGPPIFAAIVQFATLMIKTVLFCFFFVWVRWTVPRFRYDQLMNLGWRYLIPLSLANIVVTGAVILALRS